MDFDTFKEDVHGLISRRSFLESFVLPDYERFNIANIGSVVGKIFSVKALVKVNLSGDVLDDFSGVEKVVLFIVAA